MKTITRCGHLKGVVLGLGGDVLMFLATAFRSRTALVAENLFFRKQLALYRERQVKPRRASDPMRIALVLLARCFPRREVLTIEQTATLVRWHRQAFRDRQSINAPWLDAAATAMGVRILWTPVQAPQANAFCERRLGSLRRECLDYLIPFGEDHLRKILRAWRLHYNRGRPHSRLGPGLPEPAPGLPVPVLAGHRLPNDSRVVVGSFLGGLNHEYGLVRLAA